MSQLRNVGCKVEFGNEISKIYDTNGNLIGKGDQTRSNLILPWYRGCYLYYCEILWYVAMA